MPSAAVGMAGSRAHSLEPLWRALRTSAFELQAVSELRPVIRQLATEARGAGLLPEQFVLLVKRNWYELPEVLSGDVRRRNGTLLERLVTLCIEEFFPVDDEAGR